VRRFLQDKEDETKTTNKSKIIDIFDMRTTNQRYKFSRTMKLKIEYTKWIYYSVISLFIGACASQKKVKTYDTVEKTEKVIAKQHKKEAKFAQREAQKAYKRHWNNQSKETKQSIQKNGKRMKKNKQKKRNIHTQKTKT